MGKNCGNRNGVCRYVRARSEIHKIFSFIFWDFLTFTVEVPVLDKVQMLELGLLTEDGWNITAVTHGSYRWIIMLEKCFIPKMNGLNGEKLKKSRSWGAVLD